MRTIGWLCGLLLVEGMILYAASFTQTGHNFLYGNPQKREWSCVGKGPSEVLKIAADEDARHVRENSGK
jgi:hypothetical protein